MRSHDVRSVCRIRARAWLAIPIALLLARDALAQCRVEGTLRASDNAPIGGATVRMRGPDLPSPLTTTTDAEGRWAFDKVKPGVRVEIVALENGRTVARSFALVTLFVETVDLRQILEPLTGGADDLDPQGGPSAAVRGVVRSAEGAPVAGARVTIHPTTVATTTDSAGRYVFGRLRSGLALELGVSANGFKPASTEVTVPGSAEAQADFALEADRSGAGNRSLVDAPRDRNSLALDDVAGVPSVAPGDIFRTLQFLPDVAGSLESASGLYVRGGTPDETLVRFDGFTVYPFTTVFAGMSALNMDAIATADFSGDAVDAADGGRLAGALKLTGQTNATGRPTVSVGASLFGISTRVSAPLGDRATLLVAARRSPPVSLYNRVLDRLSPGSGQPVRDRAARFSGGLFGSDPQSSFDDLNTKVDLKLAPTDRLSVTFYDGHEAANTSRDLTLQSHSDLSAPEAIPLPSELAAQISDVETWNGRGTSAVWERQWSPAASSRLSIGHSEFSKTSDTSSILASSSTGQDYSFTAGRGGSSGLAESNRIEDTTVRLASSIAIGFEHAVGVGGEVTSLATDYDAQTEVVQRSTTAGLYTSRLLPLLDSTSRGRITTVFAQDAWRPVAGLTISPGARLSHYDLAASTYLEPRVNASYVIARRLRLTGAWAIDHQSVNRIVREDLMHGDGEFWALSDAAAIPIARARQVDVGVGMAGADVVWDTHAYVKALDDLALFAPRLFPGATLNQSGSMLHRGSGRAVGLETLVRYRSGWNSGWTSYTISRAEYTFPTIQAATFPASFDQTHELKIADVARLHEWSLGAAWVLGSGRPSTPATGTQQVWFPSGDSVYEVTFGAKNSERLPPYHRLDVSMRRDLRLRAAAVGVGATLFNVYDRQNVAYRDYEPVGGSFTASDVLLMRRTLNVLLTVGF